MDKDLLYRWREAAMVKNNQDTAKMRHLEPPPVQKPYPDGVQLIGLPEPDFLEDRQVSFLELMELRSTIREYGNMPLTMKELSYLLWCTQGIKMMLPAGATKRTVPSAGARNALETYLYIDKVEGLEPGLYRFLAVEHALLPVKLGGDVKEWLAPAFNKLNMYRASAVTFIWAAVLERMEYYFGGRALQYLYLDAGHVCQNLYLAAYTIGTGVCAVGHFNDMEINQLLGLDGEGEFVVYAAHAGKVR